MKVERLLQMTLAALSVLGTFLLGLGENDSIIPLVMLVAAPTSVVFTDRLGWLRLNRPLANVAALCAVGYALVDFFRGGALNQLFAIANLLLYLQLVLLFQDKNPRVYWQLLVLSLLEVVVAAAMNLSFHFGFLLIVYLALALLALALQFVIRESHRWSAQPEQAMAELMRTRILRPVLLLGLATVVFSFSLFYATPRIQGTSWGAGGGGPGAQVGFSRNVSLDEMGKILENHKLAMRVSFFDPVNGVPYDLVGHSYLRGAVLTRYGVQAAGRWSASLSRETVPLPSPADTARNLVTQEIWLEPTATPTLFAISPSFRLPDTSSDIVCAVKSGELQRTFPPLAGARGRWQYRLATTGLVNGRSLPLTPDRPAPGVLKKPEIYYEVRDCEEFDRRKFPEIAAAAERILRDADALDADRIRKARVLETHFLQSGLFTYSLDFRFPRRANVDPIEDFIGRHRTGHCEYFATALTLMLRSQKIPARLVVGYKGGEFNRVGKYLLVRQSDAHAWVEMHLEPAEVELLKLPGWQYPGEGGWWRLDPTPGRRDDDPEASSWRARWDQMLDYAEFLWSDYVQGMNPERQRQAVYEPVMNSWREQVARWLDFRLWPRRLAELEAALYGRLQNRPLFYVGVTLLVVLSFWFVWMRRGGQFRNRINSRLDSCRRWFRHLGARGSAGATVPFYARFEQLLAQVGRQRAPGETPREWLAQLADPACFGNLQEVSDASPASALRQPTRPTPETFAAAAREIVDGFYRARYSHAALDRQQLDAIERSLDVVADFVRPARALPAPRRR